MNVMSNFVSLRWLASAFVDFCFHCGWAGCQGRGVAATAEAVVEAAQPSPESRRPPRAEAPAARPRRERRR